MSPLFTNGEKNSNKQTIAILDIGSGSAGCALVQLNKNSTPSILAQARVPISLAESRESERLKRNTLKAAREAMQRVPPLSAKQIAVFLPAPWSSLFLHTIRFAPGKEFHINSDTLQKMVSECVTREKPYDKTDEVIEHSALGVKLNGYGVEELPKNIAVQNVELTVISVVAPHSFLEGIREEIRKIFNPDIPITFHSTSIASAYALSTVFPHRGDYLLCNSEGEVVECLLVSEHAPVGSATAPVGCNVILRTLQSHADMVRAEASSALSLARHATSPMATKLKTTLSSAQKECAEGFEQAAKHLLSSAAHAPHIVYMAGDGSEAVWFADAVANSTFLRKQFPKGTGLVSLTPSMFGSYVSAPAEQKNDLFLALEAIFTDARFDKNLTFNFDIQKSPSH